jgi:hypothetical protein
MRRSGHYARLHCDGRMCALRRDLRESLVLGVAEQRREGLPVNDPATVGAGDGEVHVLAADGAGEMCVLGAAVDLTTDSSAALVCGDLLNDAPGRERTSWTGGVLQEPGGVRAAITGQCRVRRKQHRRSAPRLSCDHETGRCTRDGAAAPTPGNNRNPQDNNDPTRHGSPYFCRSTLRSRHRSTPGAPNLPIGASKVAPRERASRALLVEEPGGSCRKVATRATGLEPS